MTFESTPGMGDNIQTTIDYAAEESDRLRKEYAYVEQAVEAIVEEAKNFIAVVDEESREEGTNLVKRLRDERKRNVGLHELEKMPHYRRGQGVDNFFFRNIDKLEKRSKGAPDGEADRINRLLTDYLARLKAEEDERRRLANEEAERIRREAERVQREAERLADEARLKAERARVAVSKAEKEKAAREAEAALAKANVENEVAAAKAEEARIATLAPAADMLRTRTQAGTLGTLAEENFAEITDRVKLDLEALRPYIPQPALQQALNAYARSVGYSADKSVQIVGAVFGKRPKSRVR